MELRLLLAVTVVGWGAIGCGDDGTALDGAAPDAADEAMDGTGDAGGDVDGADEADDGGSAEETSPDVDDVDAGETSDAGDEGDGADETDDAPGDASQDSPGDEVGPRQVGDPCASAEECPAGGSGTPVCIADWPDGYCAVGACADHGHDCPDDPGLGGTATTGGKCALDPAEFCLALCAGDGDCRPGYACAARPDAAGHGTVDVCVPDPAAGGAGMDDASDAMYAGTAWAATE